MDQDEIIRVPVTRRAVLETGTAAAALLFSAVPRPALAAADANPPPTPIPVTLQVNGQTHALNLDPRTTLLDALREHLILTGAKKGSRSCWTAAASIPASRSR
jgi:xanthine dehydrogenase YagT iron-sulfur-binding subunit